MRRDLGERGGREEEEWKMVRFYFHRAPFIHHLDTQLRQIRNGLRLGGNISPLSRIIMANKIRNPIVS